MNGDFLVGIPKNNFAPDLPKFFQMNLNCMLQADMTYDVIIVHCLLLYSEKEISINIVFLNNMPINICQTFVNIYILLQTMSIQLPVTSTLLLSVGIYMVLHEKGSVGYKQFHLSLKRNPKTAPLVWYCCIYSFQCNIITPCGDPYFPILSLRSSTPNLYTNDTTNTYVQT